MAESARSLLDDAGFVAALNEVEIPDTITLDAKAETRREPQWIFDGAVPAAAAASPRGQIALGVLGFTLMMGLGAAGAAFVFHDRLAQILMQAR
jgi:hypothetical protein